MMMQEEEPPEFSASQEQGAESGDPLQASVEQPTSMDEVTLVEVREGSLEGIQELVGEAGAPTVSSALSEEVEVASIPTVGVEMPDDADQSLQDELPGSQQEEAGAQLEPDLLSMMNDQVRSAIVLQDEEAPTHLDDNPGFQIPSPSAPTHTALKELAVPGATVRLLRTASREVVAVGTLLVQVEFVHVRFEVEDVTWRLGHREPALKLGLREYVFTLVVDPAHHLDPTHAFKLKLRIFKAHDVVYGLTFCEDTTEEHLEVLDDLVRTNCGLQQQDFGTNKRSALLDPEDEWVKGSQYIASLLQKGSSTLGKNIKQAAQSIEKSVETGSKLIMETTERAREPAYVHPQVLDKFEKVRTATGEGTYIISDIQQGVMEVTDVVASGAAELISEIQYATRNRSGNHRGQGGHKNTDGAEAPDPKVHAVKTVVLAGAEAFEEVFSSVVEATTTTARASTNATVDIVQHKFGDKAAQATADGLHTVGNVAQAAFSFITMGPKTVARRLATSSIKHSMSNEEAQQQKRDNRFAWMFEDLNDVDSNPLSASPGVPGGRAADAEDANEHAELEAAHDHIVLQAPPTVNPL